MIDVRKYGAVPDGVTDCINAIHAALAVDDIIIRNGTFIISDSIAIPSNRTVYIDCAEIKQKDYSYRCLFVNSDFVNGNENISIVGLGCAILNTNVPTNEDPNYEVNPLGSDTAYNLAQIHFCNVDNFTVSGLISVDRNHIWLQMQKVSNGTINNLFIDYVKWNRNLGGLIMRHQCTYLNASDLRGRTGDDFVAINNGGRFLSGVQIPEFKVGDSHHISLSDINTGYSGYRALIILNGEGNLIHDITINRWIKNTGTQFCWFGPSGYNTIDPTKDETYDIEMDDIEVNHVSTGMALFEFTQSMKNLVVSNLVNNTDKDLYEQNGGEQENVIINGITIFP